MKLNKISINSAIQNAEALIEKDDSLSPAIKTTIKMLILLISLLASRLNLTSKNSSKPPSDDKNRKRGSKKERVIKGLADKMGILEANSTRSIVRIESKPFILISANFQKANTKKLVMNLGKFLILKLIE